MKGINWPGQPFSSRPRYLYTMKQIILFLFLSVAFFSCSKKKEAVQQDLCAEPVVNAANTCVYDSNQIKALILGKWHFTQSVSSWTQQKTNPCTDSLYRSYEFLAGGAVKYFENGNYISTGSYTLAQSYAYSISATDSAGRFHLGGPISICDNYLVIDDSPVDGPRDIFVKAE